MFTAASLLLDRCYHLLARIEGVSKADSMVGLVLINLCVTLDTQYLAVIVVIIH